TVLIATGATPRVLPDARPDGERILTWRQVYDLPSLPEHLIVIGSGVTGAEFASAYLAMGIAVTPVSSRDRVLAHEHADAAPDLASVGVSQSEVDDGSVSARTVMLSLDGNARAKMAGIRDGFVKLFCSPASGRVLGGVVVAPKASELILPVSMAIDNNLSVDQLAHTITIYPSLSGSITEAAR